MYRGAADRASGAEDPVVVVVVVEVDWVAAGAAVTCETRLDSDDSWRRRWRNRRTVVASGAPPGDAAVATGCYKNGRTDRGTVLGSVARVRLQKLRLVRGLQLWRFRSLKPSSTERRPSQVLSTQFRYHVKLKRLL